MRFLNGLFGVLLVGVIACTGVGQTFTANEGVGLLIELKLTDRDNFESEVNGNWALATTTGGDCTSLHVDIVTALAQPKFDPNYNGDPTVQADKMKFQAELDALEGQKSNLYVAMVISKESFNGWNAGNPSTTIATSLAFWREKNFYVGQNGYTFAQVRTGLDTLLTNITAQNNQLATFLSVAENSAGGFQALKVQYQNLLDRIDAY